MLSSCHQAPVKLNTADEGTCCYICSKCKRDCDLYVDIDYSPNKVVAVCNDCQFESGHSRSCPQFVEGKLTIHPPCVKCDKPIKVGWCSGCHKRSNDKILEEERNRILWVMENNKKEFGDLYDVRSNSDNNYVNGWNNALTDLKNNITKNV